MHYYRAFGLTLASEVELQHVEPCSETTPDAVITKHDLSAQRRSHALDDAGRAFISTNSGVLMHWQGVGTVMIAGGDRIEVDFDPSVNRQTATMALTGPPMGVLLEQRGRLVLHASAVVMDSKAIAFMGHKGFGKSTTAAALSVAGYPLLTDDILAIDASSSEMHVNPGMPLLKLWTSSEQAIYGEQEPDSEDQPQPDKHLRSTKIDQSADYPLGALFVLDVGITRAERTTGKQAFLDVIRNSYSGRFVGTHGTTPDHFLRCSQVASSVPVFKLHRLPTLDSLPDVVEVVEETVRSL